MSKTHLVIAGALLALTVSAPASASLQIVKKARCVACHAVDKKMVGPAYREVAERYRGQPGAAAQLFEKVRTGGVGVWGAVPMMPHDAERISDENLQAAVAWILAGSPD